MKKNKWVLLLIAFVAFLVLVYEGKQRNHPKQCKVTIFSIPTVF